MTHETQGRRIVICDPDRTVLELLQIRLELAGCETFTARTGEAALETLEQVAPDALLLELDLPGMDGFAVLRALDPDGEGLAFPVLVMGKRLSEADFQRAVALGARAGLVKPFGGTDVVETVERELRAAAPARRAAVA